jgi:hypothetical protein
MRLKKLERQAPTHPQERALTSGTFFSFQLATQLNSLPSKLIPRQIPIIVLGPQDARVIIFAVIVWRVVSKIAPFANFLAMSFTISANALFLHSCKFYH